MTVAEAAADTAKDIRERILARVEKFVDECIRRDLDLRSGEAGTLTITVGRDGFDAQDNESWSVMTEDSYEEVG